MSLTFCASQPTPLLLGSQLAEEPLLLHEFFERTARRWPHRPAIDVPPAAKRPQRRLITYAELKRQSDALAHFLGDVVQEECVVAILLPRASEHLYLSQLAVLKAGAAYTSIDPAFPDDQVCNILQDAQAVAILTDAAGLARVGSVRSEVETVLNVIEWVEQIAGPIEPSPPPPWLTPANLAYIIYTSGTTGRPKGVMIEHGSIANLVQGDLQELGVSPHDRVGQSASCAYDSSVEETWFALAAGATLVVMDDETTRLGPDLISWLRDERITMFCPSPTLLRTTGCDHPHRELPDLRLIHVGGEALPKDVADRWAPGRCLVNDYGPTECTVTALRGRIELGDPISIGRPVPGMQAWVLNNALGEVEDGEQGELCLGGIGLARGYHNEPELTARKFPVLPRLGRIYRTGDLVHQGADGNFYCHGRIDAQVKIRGFRIELEAIEARLVECRGVREAACRVQGEGGQQKIVAFVVPDDSAAGACFDDLKKALRKVLPEYMVPSRFGILNKLPTTVSGKLNRNALPILEGHGPKHNGQVLAPRNSMEERLASVFRQTLGHSELVSVDHDFFNDLGGNSLLAAQLISRLRDDPSTASLAVRDLYEARTVAELAKRASAAGHALSALEGDKTRPAGRPVVATILQTLWLVLGLLLGAPLAYFGAFHALPVLTRSLGPVVLVLLAPLLFGAGLVVYTLFTVALAVLIKKLLIGRYRPLRAPVWGSFYVRNWMVQQAVRLVPWRLLEGTVFQHAVLRALGARIGRRVHLHRGVNLLQGGWDLLDIGDDVTVSQDAALRLVELEDGQVLVGPVALENGSTLDIRAGVAGNTCLEAHAYLTALSFLARGSRIPSGERWDGVPAKPAGQAPRRPALAENTHALSPVVFGLALMAGKLALAIFLALPLELLALAFALLYGVDAESTAAWIFHPWVDVWAILLGTLLVTLTVPLRLLFQLLAMRLMGRVPPGVISRFSLSYVRIWLKTGIIESASRWLGGTLLWPVWLRWAGMRIGRGCEISTIIDTIPELATIGAESFLADGIYLGGPRVHGGSVTLAPVRLGNNTFLGNHAVIAAGQQLPDDVLLGVATVADDQVIRPGTSWFGQPPFELVQREVVECDRSLTHDPTWVRYLSRLFWELGRFTLPLAPVLLMLVWFKLLATAAAAVSLPVLLLGVVPLLDFGLVAMLCLLVLALKWVLLGRVHPGQHPLWSSWCSRWDFHYVAWDFYARGPLSALEGTLLLNWYLRAMGTRVGRHVVLGSGFAHVVDPDMLEFEDGATVCCLFQAHTFEDRVLKIDHVTIRGQATVGNSAVLLYGADIGARTYVTPHSVVMKRERLLPGHCYAGSPTQSVMWK
jgi:non-ribosomal peptide synthetase-like protein